MEINKPKKFLSDDGIFNFLNILIICVLVFIVAYPILYSFFAPISSGDAVDRGAVMFFPVEFTLSAYRNIFSYQLFWRSYANTIFYTLTSSTFSMVLTLTASFALMHKKLHFMRLLNLFMMITMFFSAGMIPTFILMNDLNLRNPLGLIILGGASAFTIVIIRSAFMNVPKDLYNAAEIDGANDWQVFVNVGLPSIKPTIVVFWFMSAMGTWNAWLMASVLLRDENHIPLQLFLRRIIIQMQDMGELATIADQFAMQHSPLTTIYALIIMSMIPVFIVFPVMQKYFKRGIMEGGIKA